MLLACCLRARLTICPPTDLSGELCQRQVVAIGVFEPARDRSTGLTDKQQSVQPTSRPVFLRFVHAAVRQETHETLIRHLSLLTP